MGTSLAKRPRFVFPDILPAGSVYCPDGYGPYEHGHGEANQGRSIKIEKEPIYSSTTPELIIPIISTGKLPPTSVLHLYGTEKQYCPPHHHPGFLSSGTENWTSGFFSASTVEDLPGHGVSASKSNCALSLLSAHDHESQEYLSNYFLMGINTFPMGNPQTHYSTSKDEPNGSYSWSELG